jgi:RHS repeat-associated protein
MSWGAPDPNTNQDLIGYRLYRREVTPTSTLLPLGGIFKETKVTDLTAANGTHYEYQVESVDTAGRVSSRVPASPWSATPIDRTPPDVPSLLEGVSADTSVQLTWQASHATDIGGYRVYRWAPDTETWELLANTSSPGYIDGSVSPNSQMSYYVTAFDNSPQVNESGPSNEVMISTRESMSTLPPPSFHTSNGWDYCYGTDYVSCYLWGLQDCWWTNEEGVDDTLEPHHFICPQWTHENGRKVSVTWSTPGSNVQLDSINLYGRPANSSEPYRLWRHYDKPESLSVSEYQYGGPYSHIYNHTPPVAVNSTGLPSIYRFDDYAYSPSDTCDDLEFKASVAATVNGVPRESVLSAGTITFSPRIPAPENLFAAWELVQPDDCDYCPVLCSNVRTEERLTPNYYGLTLKWSAGGPACSGKSVELRGYHVYRSRRGNAFPPIRLTRLPVVATAKRVEYLPLVGPNPNVSYWLDPRVFGGPYGFYDGSENQELMYAVRAVDIANNEGPFSNGIAAFTDSIAGTGRHDAGLCNQDGQRLNHESGFYQEPTPSTVWPPRHPTGLSWAWHYGREVGNDPSQVQHYDVGPIAGNWATVKWNLPVVDTSHGPANDFRLYRKGPGEAEYSELLVDGETLDSIPGDDAGIRQFIWRMPLTLACEDASYAVRAYDLFERPPGFDPTVNAITVGKHKLRPENPRGEYSHIQYQEGPTVEISWDALPSCGQDLKGYTVYRSRISVNTCAGNTAPSPFDPDTYDLVGTVNAPGTAFRDVPPGTGRYFYRVAANWYDSTDQNMSGMSAPVCISGSGETSEIIVPSSSPESERLALARPGEADSPWVTEDALGRDASMSRHRVIGTDTSMIRLSFYHLDHLGTPRVITDVTGQPVSKHKYLPFGEELDAPPSLNTHEFTGHERDAETGLDYMLGRYFGSSGLLRFHSVDPSKESISKECPGSWNRYLYALGNPLLLVDRDGEEAKIFLSNNTTGQTKASFSAHVAAVEVQEKFDNAGAKASVKVGTPSAQDMSSAKQNGDIVVVVNLVDAGTPSCGKYQTDVGHADPTVGPTEVHVGATASDNPSTPENEKSMAVGQAAAHEAGHELLGPGHSPGAPTDLMTGPKKKGDLTKDQQFNATDAAKLQQKAGKK